MSVELNSYFHLFKIAILSLNYNGYNVYLEIGWDEAKATIITGIQKPTKPKYNFLSLQSCSLGYRDP